MKSSRGGGKGTGQQLTINLQRERKYKKDNFLAVVLVVSEVKSSDPVPSNTEGIHSSNAAS